MACGPNGATQSGDVPFVCEGTHSCSTIAEEFALAASSLPLSLHDSERRQAAELSSSSDTTVQQSSCCKFAAGTALRLTQLLQRSIEAFGANASLAVGAGTERPNGEAASVRGATRNPQKKGRARLARRRTPSNERREEA